MRNIIDNLKDPKKRSLTLLAIYGIFFLFVFLLIGSGGTYTKPLKDVEIKQDKVNSNDLNITSYNYSLTINNDIIKGTYYNNLSTFTFNLNNYFIENDITYVINNDHYFENNVNYNISKLLKINELISNLEEYSKTEYKDGRVVMTYLISANEFSNFYYGYPNLNDSNIQIELETNDSIISKISIDLTGIDDNLNLIVLEYSDVNNISTLNFNKDNYIYGE